MRILVANLKLLGRLCSCDVLDLCETLSGPVDWHVFSEGSRG